MRKVFLVSGKRTPIGSLLGSLSSFSGTQLGYIATKALLTQTKVDPKRIDSLIMGNVLSAGLGQNPARQVAVSSGLDASVVSFAVSKACASGMKAAMIAATEIAIGHSDAVIAGGFDSMTNAPHLLRQVRTGMRFGDVGALDSATHDGLVDAFQRMPMGFCAEKTAGELGISREVQDEFCVASYERTLQAIQSKAFEDEIVQVELPKKGTFALDEEPQKFAKDKIKAFRPAFPDRNRQGTVTAANSAKVADGACSLLLMSQKALDESGMPAVAEIVSFADAEGLPVDFSIAPVLAAQKALTRAGLQAKDIDYWEVNEAFSVVPIALMKMMGVEFRRVNVHGGAIALGHPLGMSGARLLLSLVSVLKAKSGKLGLATISNGGGGASAVIIRRL